VGHTAGQQQQQQQQLAHVWQPAGSRPAVLPLPVPQGMQLAHPTPGSCWQGVQALGHALGLGALHQSGIDPHQRQQQQPHSPFAGKLLQFLHQLMVVVQRQEERQEAMQQQLDGLRALVAAQQAQQQQALCQQQAQPQQQQAQKTQQAQQAQQDSAGPICGDQGALVASCASAFEHCLSRLRPQLMQQPTAAQQPRQAQQPQQGHQAQQKLPLPAQQVQQEPAVGTAASPKQATPSTSSDTSAGATLEDWEAAQLLGQLSTKRPLVAAAQGGQAKRRR